MQLQRAEHPDLFRIVHRGRTDGTLRRRAGNVFVAEFIGFDSMADATTAAWRAHAALLRHRARTEGRREPPVSTGPDGGDAGEFATVRPCAGDAHTVPTWAAELVVAPGDTDMITVLATVRRMWAAIDSAGLWARPTRQRETFR